MLTNEYLGPILIILFAPILIPLLIVGCTFYIIIIFIGSIISDINDNLDINDKMLRDPRYYNQDKKNIFEHDRR